MKHSATKTLATLSIVLAAAATPALAGPFVIDFELGTLSHGTLVDDEYLGVFPNVQIRAVNAVRDGLNAAEVAAEEVAAAPGAGVRNWATIWSTSSEDSSDEDLLPPFTPVANLGNFVIINENYDGCDTGECSDPDDEGGRLRNPDIPSGFFQFDFGVPVTLSSIDFIDIESEEDGATSFNEILFFGVGMTLLATEHVPATGGDKTWTTHDFDDVSGVSRLVIEMGGSGAVDNIAGTTNVPEPASWLLLGLGTLALVSIRRG